MAPAFVMLTPMRGEKKLVATGRIREVRERAGGKAKVWLEAGTGMAAFVETQDVNERFDELIALLADQGD